jgi:hypothetical protein
VTQQHSRDPIDEEIWLLIAGPDIDPDDCALDDDAWGHAVQRALSQPQLNSRTVTVSRQLVAAAARDGRGPTSASTTSQDGQFTTRFEETGDGHLVVTIDGPAGFGGLVRISWTVDRPVPTPPTLIRSLVTPLADVGNASRAMYDLGTIQDVSRFTIEPADIIDPTEVGNDSIRTALQVASPYGNAVRAWRDYVRLHSSPEGLVELVEDLLRQIP